jgi:hypothetical protein
MDTELSSSCICDVYGYMSVAGNHMTILLLTWHRAQVRRNINIIISLLIFIRDTKLSRRPH